ncbi:LIM domain-binding protein 3b isoform X2 [Pseudoliparis swirei]|uniref:LIM domain-binding protein 3b isoform X2 n=1 Tax=Pseudoliparis swirei TaxID=2059687 RepID=UPI0024BEBCF3|nr:LIM domain-binding protein 3b isoform X2 [Pseudoliparis swirei]
MTTYTATLNGPAPWGFRLQGGKDFNMPLIVSRITPGSKAVGGSLSQGDIISAIDGVSTEGMTHMDAQNKIKSGSTKLSLTMQKSKRAAAFSTATPRMDSPMSVIPHQKEFEQAKEELGPKHFGEEVQMVEAMSCDIFQENKASERNLFQVPKKDPALFSTPIKAPASCTPPAVSSPGQWMQYNSPKGLYSAETIREMMLMQGKSGQGSAASPGVPSLGVEYTPSFNPIALKDSALSTHKPIEVRGPGGKATIVHAQYNTPISMYSQDAIMDAIAGQSQVKGHEGGSLPMRDPVIDCASPVYQMVIRSEENQEMSDWVRRSATLQSKSFRMLAHITGTEYMQDPDEEALQRSRDKFESEVKGPRFAKLKNWHQGLSSQILNVQQ